MHIAFLTTEYPILGMKCGGIGIFIKHLSHLIVKSETGVKVSVVYCRIQVYRNCVGRWYICDTYKPAS